MDLTPAQARRFLLAVNGLIGRRFSGREGVMAYVRQAGCVQFDPVDVCGRSPDLSLLSRVRGYDKAMLDQLLYRDRALVDYFDKQLSILPTEDWPYFARTRDHWRAAPTRSHEQVSAAAEEALRIIAQRGPLSSRDLEMEEKIDWYWQATRLSRAVLEKLYYCGELVIHHKEGNLKVYARACDCLPAALLSAPDPFAGDEDAHLCWRVRRRIGAVGLLWNKPSDAFLGLDLKAEARRRAFARLLDAGEILPVRVEGVGTLYALTRDAPLLEQVAGGRAFTPRTEFLAPLDAMLWDRRLIKALFGFDYRWEIYTPASQRRYGAYTLPVLRGERFVGRIEAACDRGAGALTVRSLWLEPGVRATDALRRDLRAAADRLAAFNGMARTQWQSPLP